MPHNIESLHEATIIRAEEAYDAYYRRAAWKLLVGDAVVLELGRRDFHKHVMRTLASPKYRILRPETDDLLNLDALSERDIENFIGDRRSAVGPGVKTTLPKMQLIDAYLKIRHPDRVKTLRPDESIDLYASLRAERFAVRWSPRWMQEIDKLASVLSGVFIKEEEFVPTILICLVHVPKRPYMYCHLFNLNDSSYWRQEHLQTRPITRPEFTRFSGFLVFAEHELHVELQYILEGIPWSFRISPRREIAPSAEETKQQKRNNIFSVRKGLSHINGDYTRLDSEHGHYMLGMRLFEHFDKRI